ncbi:MAG: hypothetical protein NVSMB57_04150 [Actinomycetota bacterium]
MRRKTIVAFLLFALPFAVQATFAARRSTLAIPAGYHLDGWDNLGPGLDHVAFRYEGGPNSQEVNVARLEAGSPFQLRAVVGDQSVRGGGETTSSMCRRVNCVAGINGDFFTYRSGSPVGGLSIHGQAIRSPERSRPQLQISNGHLSVASESWMGQIRLENGHAVTLDGVNVPLRGGKISLYTAAWGQSTGNQRDVTELGIEIVSPRGPLVLGQDSTIRFNTTRHTGDAPIPPSGAVLAGEGAGAKALDDLWEAITTGHLSPQAIVQINSSSTAPDSVGGAPVLLRNGQLAFTIVPREFVIDRHPRTVVGWNTQGETFIVTIDGRQPGYSAGMTLLEAANLLKGMGATDAINLDGGGSTTFVTQGGKVVNHPSDAVVIRKGKRMTVKAPVAGDTFVGRIEQPVATALVIVRVPRHKQTASKIAHVSPDPRTLYGSRFLPLTGEAAVTASPVTIHALPPRSRVAAIAFALLLCVGVALGVQTRERWALLSRKR